MDYRDKNPTICIWQMHSENYFRKCYPFDGPNITGISEFVDPEETTVFLGLLGEVTEDENYTLSTIHYLVEAPATCVMRQAFEIGEIDWEDFWNYKSWVIEAKSESVLSDTYQVRYIHPSQMSMKAKKQIADLNGKSPLQRKYEALLLCRDCDDFDPCYANQLAEIEQKYGHLLIAA